MDEKRMRPGHRPLVRVRTPCFLQCFDTVGWVTGRTSGPKNLRHLFSKVSLWKMVELENRGELAKPGFT